MAAPQTHGLITVILLGIIGWVSKISNWEFFSAILFGVGIDFFDHIWSKSYVKDILRRIREGGAPADDVKIPISWLHLWPGFVLAWGWGTVFYFLDFDFAIYFPFLFWLAHVSVDKFQKDSKFPHRSFFYPLNRKKIIPKIGYPVKPVIEFVIGSLIWMAICFVLLGLLILK